MLASLRFRCAPSIAALSLTIVGLTNADPIAFNRAVEVYANVADPMMLSFAPNGDLYVGRDNWGSGGGANDSVRIHRILAHDRSVAEFGAAIVDPDAVLFDPSGVYTGTAGGALLGGSTPTHFGMLTADRPDGSSQVLVGPTRSFVNPNDFAIDSQSRVIFADHSQRDVKLWNNGTVRRFFATSAAPICVAVDAHNGDIFTTALDGVMSRHAADGSVITAVFAAGLGDSGSVAIEPGNSLLRPMPAGPSGGGGGSGGGDPGDPGDPNDGGDGGGIIIRDYEPTVYSIANGELLRIYADGTREVLGNGFGAMQDIAFGPDGALYASDFSGDRVLRIVPEPGTLVLAAVGVLFALKRRAE